MTETKPTTPRPVRCPTCKKSFDWNAESISRPFCSERCRLIDLGDWLEERNRIPDSKGSQTFLPPDESLN